MDLVHLNQSLIDLPQMGMDPPTRRPPCSRRYRQLQIRHHHALHRRPANHHRKPSDVLFALALRPRLLGCRRLRLLRLLPGDNC